MWNISLPLIIFRNSEKWPLKVAGLVFPLNLVVLATSQVGRVPVLGDGQETVGFWRLVNNWWPVIGEISGWFRLGFGTGRRSCRWLLAVLHSLPLHSFLVLFVATAARRCLIATDCNVCVCVFVCVCGPRQDGNPVPLCYYWTKHPPPAKELSSGLSHDHWSCRTYALS